MIYFTYRIEFQLRGLPHAHGVFWFDPEEMKPYYLEDSQEFDNEQLVKLIDSFITCEIPNSNSKIHQTVLDVQNHRHTKKCQIPNSFVCKYKFPRFPSNKTIISKPLDTEDNEEIANFLKNRSIVLSNVQLVLTNSSLLDTCNSLEDILVLVGSSNEEYEKFLSVSDTGINVILKRSISEIFINNYNATFLEAWNANMDIQMCTDSYAVITYICDYFTKSENNLTTKLHDVFKETKILGERESKFCLKNTYLAQREISICEAIYRLFPSLLMKNSNITTVFLNSNIPNERACFMKNVKNFPNQSIEGQSIQLQGHEGEFIKLKSIHDKYSIRPKKLNITLAQFTILYIKCNSLPKNIKMNDDCSDKNCKILNIFDESPLPRYIKLKDKTFMKARPRHIVLRFHKFDELSNSFSFAYSNMLMYLPWFCEENDLHCNDVQKCLEKYEQNKDSIRNTKKNLFPFSGLVQVGESNERSDFFKGIHLDNAGTMENEECDEIGEEISFRHPGDFEKLDTEPGSFIGGKYKTIDISNETELYNIARQLVVEQKHVFNSVIKQCFNLKCYSKAKISPPNPIYLLVHGGGGVGKTNLIKAISKWGEKILRSEEQSIYQPRILLTSLTGTAAAHIDGVTLHTAFSFGFGSSSTSNLISDEKLDALRKSLQYLKIIIIDEISMVSADMFYCLNKRLCSIFQNLLPFGGISIILVGDLMQLKPVRGRYIFQIPIDLTYFDGLGLINLWDMFTVFILQHNHRQGKALQWSQVLNKIRFSLQTDNDLFELNKNVLTTWNEKKYGKKSDATFIFYTNLEVNIHNEAMILSLKQPEVSISAKVFMPVGRKYHQNLNGQIDDTGFMSVLRVKKGAKVMIIKNIDTLDCLTNGAMGIIKEIISRNSEVYCLLIKFADEKIGAMRRLQYSSMLKGKEELTPIMMVEHSYQIPSNHKQKKHFAQCTIQQFPLRLAFAVTAHKVQGHTFSKGNTVVINLHRKKFPDGMIYVMLSRNCNLEDILINRPIQSSDIQCSQIAKTINDVLTIKNFERISDPYLPDIVLEFGFLNVRSLKKHFLDIFDFSYVYSFDCFAVCETWLLSNDNIEEFIIPGYIIHNNPAGKGKGLAVYYRKGRIVTCCASPYFQLTALLHNNVVIVFVYISSNCPLSDVLDQFHKINESYLSAQKIFVGDFNFSATNKNSITSWMKENSYYQHVKFPTHILGNLIDHVYANNIMQYNLQIKNNPVYFSDHVLLKMQLKKIIN